MSNDNRHLPGGQSGRSAMVNVHGVLVKRPTLWFHLDAVSDQLLSRQGGYEQLLSRQGGICVLLWFVVLVPSSSSVR